MFLVDLISVQRFGWLTSREPGVGHARHRRRSQRAGDTQDGRFKSPGYFACSWLVRAYLTWLGCLGTETKFQVHAIKIGDYMSRGDLVISAAASYTFITTRAVEKWAGRWIFPEGF